MLLKVLLLEVRLVLLLDVGLVMWLLLGYCWPALLGHLCRKIRLRENLLTNKERARKQSGPDSDTR